GRTAPCRATPMEARTPGTSCNTGATAGRAATEISASGASRPTSAIAGSAMTASPSQFGARMTRRFIVWYGRCGRALRAYHDMKIALLQVNPTVGDLQGNRTLIVDALREAADAGADLAVTPELALVGYLPRDLLLSAAFVRKSREALDALACDAVRLPAGLGGVPDPNPSAE